MRGLLTTSLLLALPLAGCLGGPGTTITGVFSLWDLPEGDPIPVRVSDCQTLLQTLNERALAEADAALRQAINGHRYHGPVVFAADTSSAEADGAPGGGSAGQAEFTGTNNQEAAADEADVLKTDGEWTYVAKGQTVYVMRSHDVGDVEAVSQIDLGDGYYAGQLLLVGRDLSTSVDDRLVIVSQTWDSFDADDTSSDAASSSIIWHGGNERTRIQVFSLADRAQPALEDVLWIDGRNVGARLVDGHVYVVVHSYNNELPLTTWIYPSEQDLQARGLDWDSYSTMNDISRRLFLEELAQKARAENRALVAQAKLENYLPALYEEDAAGKPSRVAITEESCQGFLATPDSTGRSASTILAMSLSTETIHQTTTQILGSTPIVYASGNALVLAAPSRDTWWFFDHAELDESTDLHWFDLFGLDVRHRASGRSAGIVQDSFGIDVHGDTLRVATTTGQWGRWWLEDPEPMLNHIAVFNEVANQLVPVGLVSGIAPGERIWSARFTDERAYIVTFEQVDPLWVIDLSNPQVPTILGELEIPGVSTYIHPLSDDLLLTIGYGPGADGLGLDWGKVQVSLFDISNPASPRRAAVLDVAPESGHAWSGAVREHKAFTYWSKLGTLAIPVSTHNEWIVETEAGSSYEYSYKVGLRLIHVDEAAKSLSHYGEVDQSALIDSTVDEDSRWRYHGVDVERSYFLGLPDSGGPVSVYAMSGRGVTAHDYYTLAPQGSVAFEGDSSPYVYHD